MHVHVSNSDRKLSKSCQENVKNKRTSHFFGNVRYRRRKTANKPALPSNLIYSQLLFSFFFFLYVFLFNWQDLGKNQFANMQQRKSQVLQVPKNYTVFLYASPGEIRNKLIYYRFVRNQELLNETRYFKRTCNYSGYEPLNINPSWVWFWFLLYGQLQKKIEAQHLRFILRMFSLCTNQIL